MAGGRLAKTKGEESSVLADILDAEANIERAAASGFWQTTNTPNADADYAITAIVTREPDCVIQALQSHCVMEYCTFISDVHELVDVRARSNVGAVLLDRDDVTDLVALGRQTRSHVAEGPAVILTGRSLPAASLFELMEVGVSVLPRWSALQNPGMLSALLLGAWPDVRMLNNWCRQHRLSPMETRAFVAAVAGMAKVDAAALLGCSIRTLESHWSRMFAKFGIRSTDGVLAATLRALLCSGSGPPAVSLMAATRRQRRG